MENPIRVQVEKTVEELEQDRADHFCWNGVALGLGVVVDYLEEVVLCVFEDHENAFIF